MDVVIREDDVATAPLTLSKYFTSRAADLYAQGPAGLRGGRHGIVEGAATREQVCKAWPSLSSAHQRPWIDMAKAKTLAPSGMLPRDERGRFKEMPVGAAATAVAEVVTPTKQPVRSKRRLQEMAALGEAFVDSVEAFTSPAKTKLQRVSCGRFYEMRRFATAAARCEDEQECPNAGGNRDQAPRQRSAGPPASDQHSAQRRRGFYGGTRRGDDGVYSAVS